MQPEQQAQERVRIEPRWLDVEQASAYTGFATSTLYHWVSDRKVPFVKKGRSVRFDRLALDDFMLRDQIPSVDEF
jgi:excisionase family DNA binding protein